MAECAWVLWVKASTDGTWLGTDGWDSFRLLSDCQKAAHSKKMKDIVAEKRRDVLLVPVCFPDTVDPCGPKGH